MTDLLQVPEILAAAARGRGVASVAVIERAGGEPHAYWAPQSNQEPAFLAYSITKTFTAALILQLGEEGQLRLDDGLAVESAAQSVSAAAGHATTASGGQDS